MNYKKTRSAIAATMLLIATSGCFKLSENSGAKSIYRYINKTGVEVALVGKANKNFNIPDSIVIPNGGTFECSYSYPSTEEGGLLTFPFDLGNQSADSKQIPMTIYYNKEVHVSYTPQSLGKNPTILGDNSSYSEKRTDGKNFTLVIWTYTFTEQDYQKAIEK